MKEALDVGAGLFTRLPYAAAAFAPETDVFDVPTDVELEVFAFLVVSGTGFKIEAERVEPIAIGPAFKL